MFASLTTVLEEIDLGTSFTGLKLVLSAVLAFYCHRMLLVGDDFGWDQVFAKRDKNQDDIKFWPFLWRLFVSTLLFIIMVSVIYFLIRGFVTPYAQGAEAVFLAYLLSAIIALPLAGVALALFGTVFPAAAINSDTSLRSAYNRGKQRFLITLWRLFFGFFCFTAVSMALYVAVIRNFGLDTTDTGPVYYLLSFAATLAGSFSTLLGATALSLAYEETTFKNPF